MKPPPVQGVCGYSYLGISCVGSWLSCGDSILLFVPCGPGSVRPSLRFFFVILPSVWCLSVVTDGHTSSDWSPGPMLVDVRLGVYMHRGWVVSGLCF